MRTREKILLVDDASPNLAVLSAALEPEGYEILAASDGAMALKVAALARPDLVLLDVVMPGLDGFETCRRLKAIEGMAEVPVIFLTARTGTGSLVEGFRAGAVDYISKPFEAEEVLSRVSTHVRLSRLARELKENNRKLEARTAELLVEMEKRRTAESALQQADARLDAITELEADRFRIGGYVGKSAASQKVVSDVERLHSFPNTSVLILGESGTGKELIARAIHFGSPRARAPFVPVNCVAIPPDLAESMLFGHIKGAFTGATSDRKGCFELAQGGTLFLDEVGDMPAALQVKLLRVLEDGQVTPVGASQPRRVDVRVIAATNAVLEDRVAGGSFREDLYFRLARYVITTTPLRERVADVLPLVEHFLARFAAELGGKPPTLSPETAQLLQAYSYPGNVRELRNIIERAIIDSGGGVILPTHLHLQKRSAVPTSSAPVIAPSSNAGPFRTPISGAELPMNLEQAEDLLIQRALQETQGNIADAARLLGVHRTRIYRRLAQQESAPH